MLSNLINISVLFLLLFKALGLNGKLWNLGYMKDFVGNEYHHKVRKFERSKPEDSNTDQTKTHSAETVTSFRETDGFMSMKIADFIAYLEKRSSLDLDSNPNFTFKPFNAQSDVTINVEDTGLYMLDFDIVKLLPECYNDLLQTFKMTSLLPGGSHCMMNAVSI